jgi:hypothetical protein
MKALQVMYLIIGFICFIMIVVYAFMYPNYTQTQVFIDTWPITLIMIISFLLVYMWRGRK